MSGIKTEIKDFILEEFLPGEDPALLTDTTPLLSGGVLDSISTVKLVVFLEEQFGVKFHAHEMSVDYLNSVEEIARVVEEKRSAG
jgi:acyl carrier protein